ncbi:MAG: LysR family transcriptional regulator [Oscillospiraceae bacterium]
MNFLHLKYAVEVEATRSISKAAENLHMNQPNLSRAIKELEESLGITIFNRTSKGIDPTPRGEEFLMYARQILRNVEELEAMYQGETDVRQRFSISVPRASYLSCAFTEFARSLDRTREAEIVYKETNSMKAITNLLRADYKLGVIRYQVPFEPYFRALLRERELTYKVISEFSYVALMSKHHPLAPCHDFALSDLSAFIEIAHPDTYVPSLSLMDSKKAELSELIDKRIFVFERASQMDLLSQIPNTFMWVSPIPQRLLAQYGLVEKVCTANVKRYKDVLIHRKGYHLTALDQRFLDQVDCYKPK